MHRVMMIKGVSKLGHIAGPSFTIFLKFKEILNFNDTNLQPMHQCIIYIHLYFNLLWNVLVIKSIIPSLKLRMIVKLSLGLKLH